MQLAFFSAFDQSLSLPLTSSMRKLPIRKKCAKRRMRASLLSKSVFCCHLTLIFAASLKSLYIKRNLFFTMPARWVQNFMQSCNDELSIILRKKRLCRKMWFSGKLCGCLTHRDTQQSKQFVKCYPFVIYLYVTQTLQIKHISCLPLSMLTKPEFDFRLPIFGLEIPATLVH